MKKIILILCLCAIIAICAGLAWLRYGSSGYVSSLLAQYSRQYTGEELRMQGAPEISLFPPRLVFSGLSWHSADNSCEISAASLKIFPEILSILTGKLALKEILLESPVIRLRQKSGQSAPNPKTDSPKSGAAKAAGPKNLPFEIGRLLIQKGDILIESQSGLYSLKNVNLSAENLRNRQEASLAGDFALAVAGNRDAKNMGGNLAFRGKFRYYAPNLSVRQGSLTFTATQGKIPVWLSPLQLSLDAALNVNSLDLRLSSASLASAQGNLNFRGEGNLAEAWFSGQCTLALDLAKILGQKNSGASEKSLLVDTTAQFANDKLLLSEIAVKAPNTEGSGNLALTLPQNGREAALTGNLFFRNLELWPPEKVNNKAEVQSQPQKSASSKPPFSEFPEIDLRLSADKFRYGSFTAANVKAKLLGSKGDYSLHDGEMRWADGQIQCEGSCDFADSRFSVNASGKNINAGKALTEAGFSGFSGGSADFDAKLAASALDLRGMANSLSGKASFSASDIKIMLLEKLADFLPATMAKNSFFVLVQLFMADIQADGGKIKIEPFKLAAKGLQASGQADYTPESGDIKGKLDIRLGPVSLPLEFHGPANNISFGLTGGFFRKLWQDLP